MEWRRKLRLLIGDSELIFRHLLTIALGQPVRVVDPQTGEEKVLQPTISEQIAASREILDRAYGKPVAFRAHTVQVLDDEEHERRRVMVEIQNLSPEDRKQLQRLIRGLLGAGPRREVLPRTVDTEAEGRGSDALARSPGDEQER